MKVSKDLATERFKRESAALTTPDAKKNLLREILQETLLCHMKETGFFNDMAFHGGTSLRLLHRIDRFSEDLDMSLFKADASYDLVAKMELLKQSVVTSGFKFEFQNKVKNAKVIKTFYINDTEILAEFSDLIGGSTRGEKIKVKFELDVMPSDHQTFVDSQIQSAFAETVRAHDLQTCMGQKIHAVLCRSHFYGMDIIKGRDLYDLEWYLEKNVRPNYANLQECLFRGGPWEQKKLVIDKSWVIEEFQKSLQTKNFKTILEDLKPLIDSATFRLLSERWGKKYFSDLVETKIVK